MDQAPPPFNLWAELAWVGLAMMGGIARYLDTHLRTATSPKFGMILAHALVSGFSGYMVAQVALRVQPEWALVAAGVGGYLGTQGLDWLSEVLKRRLGGPNDKEGAQ